MARPFYRLSHLLLPIIYASALQPKISASEVLVPMHFKAELISAAASNSNQCTEQEFQCTSCSLLSIKIATSAGNIVAQIECNATNGEYCNPYLKRCSSRKSYCSTGGGFQCHHEGRFPHPFECNVYYECSLDSFGTPVAEEHICPPGTSYNAKTYRCDGSANDPICQGYPAPECPDSPCLDINPLPQNPNIFYTCENGAPQLYKCVEGEDFIYDPVLFQCIRNDSVSVTSTEPPHTTTTGEPDNSTSPDVCLPHLKYHVPYTCGWYYNCSKLPTPSWTLCGPPTTHYFDRETRNCVVGVCPYNDDNDAICNGIANGTFPIRHHCNSRYMCLNNKVVAVNYCGTSCYFDRDTKEFVKDASCPYKDL